MPYSLRLSKAVHDQRHASGEQAAADERGAEVDEDIGITGRLSPLPQIAYTALNHEDGQGHQRPHKEPPGKGSKRHRSSHISRDNSRGSPRVATLAKGPRAVKNRGYCSKTTEPPLDCAEFHAESYSFASGFRAAFTPR